MAFANGLRPGLHGQSLISTGLADLDRILGGGLPLGSLLLVIDDGASRHHETLARYFLAEGAACGQSCFLAAAQGVTDTVSWLPKEGRVSKAAEEDEAEDAGAELRIAWQYRRYIKARQLETEEADKAAKGSKSGFKRAGSSSSKAGAGGAGAALRWCHDFDLTEPMTREYLEGRGTPEPVSCLGPGPTASLSKVVRGAASFVGGLYTGQGEASGPGIEGPVVTRGSGDAQEAAGHLKSQEGSPPASTPGGPSPTAHSAPSTPGPQGGEPPKPATGRPLHPALAARLAQRNAQLAATVGAAGRPAPVGGAAPATPQSAAAAAASTSLAARQRGPGGQIASIPAREVGRLAFLSLGGPGWAAEAADGAALEADVFRTLVGLSRLVNSGGRASALVTLPGARASHVCHCVVQLEALGDKSGVTKLVRDPQSCAGLLRVAKMPALGNLCPTVPDCDLYLVRHWRRRLAIKAVEFDPDAMERDLEGGSGSGSGSAGGGPGTGSASTASKALCGGPPGASSSLDF